MNGMNDETRLAIVLDHPDGVYRPGDVLRGEFRLQSGAPLHLERAEVSVGWLTEGKGDTDECAVHDEDVAVGTRLDLGNSFSFSARLPMEPWSYDGQIIKICWAVRVILHPVKGKARRFEERFRLEPERLEPERQGA